MNRDALLCGSAGLAALVLCSLGGRHHPAEAFDAYLAGYVFWLGLSLGSVSLLLLLVLLGGSWETALRPVLAAAAGAMPLLLLLALPLIGGLPLLYPWMHPAAVSADEELRRQTAYLNQRFFLLRAAGCFCIWLWLAYRLRRPAALHKGAAAAGALLMLLSVSVMAVDWIMSLQPQFRSSSFGLTVGVSQMLAALALALVLRRKDLPSRASNDAGGLLLVLLLAWSYLEFMSYLTVWTGDLPPETAWYLPRTQTSWKWLALAMLLLQFLAPFLILLSARARQSRALAAAAATILAGNIAEAWWRTRPALHPAGLVLGPYDLAALVGIGGLWLALFMTRLQAAGAPQHG